MRLVAAVTGLAIALAPLPVSAGPRKDHPVASALWPALQATVDHPPVDNVVSFDSGPRDSGRVALTFDADMTPGMLRELRAGQVRSWYNQQVRDVLDAERVPATIFMTGLWAETYPDVARSLAEDPLFEIGSHTYDHAAFRTPCYGLFPATDRRYEIERAQESIQSVTGVRPMLLRFPGDCYNRDDQALAAGLGLTVISGDVRGGDGFNPSPAAIASRVLGSLRPGSIVVLHIHGGPNAPMTGLALPAIIAGVRARGLGFATVSEVLGRPGAALPRQLTAAEVLRSLRARSLAPPAVIPLRQVLARLRSRPIRPPVRPAGPLPGT